MFLAYSIEFVAVLNQGAFSKFLNFRDRDALGERIKLMFQSEEDGALFRSGCHHGGYPKFHFDLQDTESRPVTFLKFTGYVKMSGV